MFTKEVTKTIPFEAIFGLAAGMLMGICCQRPLQDVEHLLKNRFGAVVLMFALGGMMPAGLVMYVQYPDWSLMYMANPDHIPQWLVIPTIALLYSFSPVVGFLLFGLSVKKKYVWMTPLLVTLITLSVVILAGWGWDRLAMVGYYNDFFYKGTLIPLSESTLFSTLLAVSLVVFTLLGSCLYFIRSHVAELHRSAQYQESLSAKLAAESPTLPPH